MHTLADRIRYLIDNVNGGSVNAAAQHTHLTQTTLTRIVNGTVQNPRAKVLRAIADTYGTTVDWLLTGKGSAPKPVPKTVPISAAYLRWMELVDALVLSPDLKQVLTDLPTAPIVAALELAPEDVFKQKLPEESRGWFISKAAELSFSAWAALFVGLHAVLGADGLRRALDEHADELRLGFSPLPLQLLKNKKLPEDWVTGRLVGRADALPKAVQHAANLDAEKPPKPKPAT